MSTLRGDDYKPHLSPRDDSMNSAPEERSNDGRQAADPAVLVVSERTPLINQTYPSIESVGQSQAARQRTANQGIGRIRLSVGDTNRWSASRAYDSEFGCRGEIWINVAFLFVFCMLYGSLFLIYEFVTNTFLYKSLVYMAVHVLQFVLVFCQFLRANDWSSKMKREGYLTLPSDLATIRKAGVIILGFSSSLLCVLLSFIEAYCTKSDKEQTDKKCNNFWDESKIVFLYLGIELFFYFLFCIIYVVRIARYRKSHLWPDVVNEAARENVDLSHGGGVRGSLGPILTITDELRIGEDYELDTGEDVFESQTALIGYLKHRNSVLSEKLHTLSSQIQAGQAVPPHIRV